MGIWHTAGGAARGNRKGLEEGRASRIEFELGQLLVVVLNKAKIESERGQEEILPVVPRLDGCAECSEIAFGLFDLEDRVGRLVLLEPLQSVGTQGCRDVGAMTRQ